MRGVFGRRVSRDDSVDIDLSDLMPKTPVSLGVAPPTGVIELRSDGWQNPFTGIGTGRDKTAHGRFFQTRQLDWEEEIALYNGSDLARKAVRKPWDEMLRRGYTMSAQDVDEDEITALRKQGHKLRVDELMRKAGIFGGLFGGGIIFLGADDGQTPDKPLREDRIKSFRFMNFWDRRFMTIAEYYSDLLQPNFGQPKLYRVTNLISGGVTQDPSQTVALIHESRVIRFDGADTDDITRRQLAGWTYSVLQAPYDSLRRFEHSTDSINHLLSDAAQGVFKLQGLIEMIAAGEKEAVLERMRLLDQSRGTARAVVVDAETEDFTRVQTPLGGVADILDRMMMRIAAAFDMPVTELFGRSAAGMNATGENDVRKWYSQLESRQTDEVGPKLKRIYNLMASAWDSPVSNKEADFEITFRSLWSPTEKEVADVQYTTAQADALMIQNGVYTPEQVLLARWGSGKFNPNIYLSAEQIDALETAIENQKAFDPYENDPVQNAAAGAARESGTDPNVVLNGQGGPAIGGLAQPGLVEGIEKGKPGGPDKDAK